MAIHAQEKPFPLTPYPFQRFDTDVPMGLASISEWLDLPEQSEGYHPEDNALTPEEWVACDGQEDATWVVGDPDWLEEGTKQIEVVSGGLSRPESSSSSGDSTTSISDVTSPHDTNTNLELPQGQTEDHSLPIDIPDKTAPFHLNTMRGVIRRRDSEEEIQLPERKRPRLERLVIDQIQQSIASPRVLTPPQIQYNSTPISPERQFYRILAEKSSKDGIMFKVVWRESWVHESKMPDIEPIRRAQFAQTGVAWDILPGVHSPQY